MERYLVSFLLVFGCLAFQPNTISNSRQRETHLYDVSNWRKEQYLASPTELHLLAFPVSEALIPGESTTILLKEGRFFDIVDDAFENHHSLIVMATMGDDGITTDGMPLCEIVNMEVLSGFRGKITINVKLESVGRVKLLELTEMKPTMRGRCLQLLDDVHTDQIPLAARKKSQDMASELEKMLTNLNGGTYLSNFEESLCRAMKVVAAEHGRVNDDDDKIAATSWAVLSCLPKSSSITTSALASTDVFHRLQLGAKAILAEQISPFSSNSTDMNFRDDLELDIGNFE